jgi:U3 small nucleolar ribonucleoprotein component
MMLIRTADGSEEFVSPDHVVRVVPALGNRCRIFLSNGNVFSSTELARDVAERRRRAMRRMFVNLE